MITTQNDADKPNPDHTLNQVDWKTTPARPR